MGFIDNWHDERREEREAEERQQAAEEHQQLFRSKMAKIDEDLGIAHSERLKLEDMFIAYRGAHAEEEMTVPEEESAEYWATMELHEKFKNPFYSLLAHGKTYDKLAEKLQWKDSIISRRSYMSQGTLHHRGTDAHGVTIEYANQEFIDQPNNSRRPNCIVVEAVPEIIKTSDIDAPIEVRLPVEGRELIEPFLPIFDELIKDENDFATLVAAQTYIDDVISTTETVRKSFEKRLALVHSQGDIERIDEKIDAYTELKSFI